MKAGWRVAPVGDVVRLNYGKAIAKEVRGPVGPVPVYGANGIMDYCDEALANGPSIIVGRKGSAGAINVAVGPFWASDVSYFTQHDPLKIDFSFLLYLLQQLDLPSLAKGVKPGINRDEVYSLLVTLPPLEEQKRIVAVLDEAFEGLDRARANAEANLADARELFGTLVNAAFADKLYAARHVELQALCDQRGITYGVIKLGDHIDDGVPCLRTSNVRPLSIELDGIKKISPSLSREYRRTILRGGEVLVNVRGTLGGVCVVPAEMTGWNISREVAMVPVMPDAALPEYIAYFISSQDAQNWLTGVVKGAAYKGINLTDLRIIKIPMLSLSDQRKLVDELDEARRDVDPLIGSSSEKLLLLDAIRQSLLQKAFSGELT